MNIAEFQWFLTSNGFRQLLALLGRNQQGIGTSSLAMWVKHSEESVASQTTTTAAAAPSNNELSQFIDAIYTKIDDGKSMSTLDY
jgi:hypothetical protein